MKLKLFGVCLATFISNFILTGATAVAEERGVQVAEEALQGVVRTNLDSPQPTSAQLERKRKYTAEVKALGGPVNQNLPVVEDAAAIEPREKADVARRAIAVAIAAVKAEGMPHEQVRGIIDNWGAESYFSPEELAFVNTATPSEKDRSKFSWRYEGLDVLLWALGYKEALPPPDQICDVESDVGVIVSHPGDALATQAQLRSMDEILDMADFYYRLHWAAIELRMKGASNAAINEEIIMERHYALNWLIRYMNQDWDAITTDT
ncbi:DUF4272 domain-containing protein [Hahella sp. CR1]|uniref:DUF4272 domain-containing protein n=1 Tax=Hahella sp. CR1 TaxID=2992807 RepID=UPI002442024A|nr:DUF4272 domain-containing protein [Hahella sp. CR1]MDG9670517.1 DUF4272 domain-containing protein [Hahella sp. CR1]